MDGGDSLDPKVDLNERINKKMKSSTGSGAYAAELTINNANLSKFGNAKWDSLGKEELKRIQKIEHDQKPNWFTELDKEMPPEFKLELEDVKISYDINADDLEPLGA